MSPDTVFGVLVALGLAALWAFIGMCFWWKLPLLTRAEGSETHQGWVTRIERLPGFLVEVTLSADVGDTDCPVVLRGAPIHLIHLRPSQQIPRLGELITARTVPWSYRFQNRSLNWVHFWSGDPTEMKYWWRCKRRAG